MSSIAVHPGSRGVIAVGNDAGITIFNSQLQPLSSQSLGNNGTTGVTALTFNEDDPRYLYCACPSPTISSFSSLSAAALPRGAQAPAVATVVRLDGMRGDGIISWDSPASLRSVVFEDVTGMGISSISFASASLLYGCESGELVLQKA